MKNIKTINNLAKAFVGESMARNRYTFYAKIAKKEGYEKIAEIFELTAENEKEHAKWLLRLINNLKNKYNHKKELNLTVDIPTTLGSTIDNLKAAIKGENYEHQNMYPEFADIAEEEGFSDIAKRLRAIAMAEKHHEERFKKILKELEKNSLYKKESKTYWVCRKCGYIHESKEPPEICPSCNHPKNYFEKKCEDY